MGHAEIAARVLIERLALAVADDRHRLAVQAAQPAPERGVVAKTTVAVQLDHIFKQQRQVVGKNRTLTVADQIQAVGSAAYRADFVRFQAEHGRLYRPASWRVQREQLAQRGFHAVAGHDQVQKAVLLQKLGPLEAFRQLLGQRPLDDAPAREADQGTRF